MIEVKTLDELNAIQDPIDGELVKVGSEEDYKYYTHKEGEWVEQSTKVEMNLYEINKQVFAQQPNLSKEKIKSQLKDYLYDKKISLDNDNNYYMLLCNDLHYYTIFKTGNGKDYKTLLDEFIDLLENFDNIKHIEPTDGGLEIWGTLLGNFALFMFFNYTQGVIECQ